jgi:hypothetical protein
MAALGRGRLPTRVDSSSHSCEARGGVVGEPAFTGKIVWHEGHLMRAPPGGIFLSSTFRPDRHDGHETFMRLLQRAFV